MFEADALCYLYMKEKSIYFLLVGETDVVFHLFLFENKKN